MSDVEKCRQAVVDEHGPWRGFNFELAPGLWTMGPGLVGAAEHRVAQVLRLVADHAPRPLDQLRVLDLGAHEGGFGLELARHGAAVHGIEGREHHVAKARFAADVLGLSNARFDQGDVRQLDADVLGTFDVVLCLGLLYHLGPTDVFPLVERMGAVCSGFALIETNISLARKRTVRTTAGTFHGRLRSENPRFMGAALDAEASFWPTRASLLNMLAAAGFTSVTQVLSPPVLPVAAYRDHLTWLAHRGRPVDVLTMPQVGDVNWRWPEDVRERTGPTNSAAVRWLDKARRRRGKGLAAGLRRKR